MMDPAMMTNPEGIVETAIMVRIGEVVGNHLVILGEAVGLLTDGVEMMAVMMEMIWVELDGVEGAARDGGVTIGTATTVRSGPSSSPSLTSSCGRRRSTAEIAPSTGSGETQFTRI